MSIGSGCKGRGDMADTTKTSKAGWEISQPGWTRPLPDRVVKAVDGISATKSAGEVIGFPGRNGTGKTTTPLFSAI